MLGIANLMQYRISKPFIGYSEFIEISQDRFEEAKLAIRNLREVLSIEEKFNLILENYAEFERELLGLSLNHAMFSHQDWFSFQIEIHTINRRLINLLTTCRLYVDQIPQNVNSIYGEVAGVARIIKKTMSDEYDSSLSYRVLEALRNYVQHRGLPVYGLKYGSSRNERASGAFFKHTLTPSLNVARLKEEKKFKASVLNELEAIGKEIDLKPFVRHYIDSLGRIHGFLRETLETDITKWDSTIFDVQKQFREGINDEADILSLEVWDPPESLIESLDILGEIIEHRQWLIRKNQMITHFSSHIITSEADSRDA